MSFTVCFLSHNGKQFSLILERTACRAWIVKLIVSGIEFVSHVSTNFRSALRVTAMDWLESINADINDPVVKLRSYMESNQWKTS